MKSCKFLLLLFILAAGDASAHVDFWKTQIFGKVKVRIKTGYHYEEINKAWIIGELSRKLADKLNYTDTIFLDFNHHYTGDCLPDYFVSFCDGTIKYTWPGDDKDQPLKTDAIIIREVSRKFDAAVTLRLVEYAIQNLASVKRSQKPFTYEKNYCQWLITTIDTAVTRKLSLNASSKLITEVMASKIYRSKLSANEIDEISYYFRDNKYHIFYRDREEERVLLTVDHVYQLTNTSYYDAIVMDTDNSFYYVQGKAAPLVSRRLLIKNKDDFFRPYDISTIGFSKIALSFLVSGRQSRERTLLYLVDSDKLIQDLDKQLGR